MNISTATLSCTSIGKNREVKKASESFWRNNINAEYLLQIARTGQVLEQFREGINVAQK